MKYLGLDIGDRWIGVASATDSSGLSTPLKTLRRSTKKQDIAVLLELCASERADAIVVGLPYNMDGSVGFQGQKTLAFAKELETASRLPTAFCDERLSSATALEHAVRHRGKPARSPARIDHIAAALILEDYLRDLAHAAKTGA